MPWTGRIRRMPAEKRLLAKCSAVAKCTRKRGRKAERERPDHIRDRVGRHKKKTS